MDEIIDGLLKDSFRKENEEIKVACYLMVKPLHSPKLQIVSEQARKEGNDLFLAKSHSAEIHKEILNRYSRSMALAPIDSEALAFAFGNRSAFLKHLNKYEECISDIDKALDVIKKINAVQKFDVFKLKLLCRKVECLKLLGKPGWEKILADISLYYEKMDDNNENRVFISKLVEAAKNKPFQRSSKQIQDFKKCVNSKDGNVKGVCVNYDEKYGRHLISNQDFKAGDVIYVEKAYAAVQDFGKSYTNCNNCHITAWSSIPCEFCNWVVYCSNTCKDQAWKNHHELECDAVPILRKKLPIFMNGSLLHFRLLCQAVQEATSIESLRIKIEKAEASPNFHKNHCLKNGKIESTFESIFSLISHKEDDELLATLRNWICCDLWISIICLLKFTNFFKSDILTDIDDLIKNENIYFIAKLFLRIFIIKRYNAHEFTGSCDDCKDELKMKSADIGPFSDINFGNSCIAPFTSLMNHSCFPNVAHICTDNQKLVIFALQPIKRNSQLFSCYTSVFFEEKFEVRKEEICKYQFICNCLACIKKWPPILSLAREEGLMFVSQQMMQNERECKIVSKCLHVFEALEEKEYHNLNKSSITKLSTVIDKLMQNVSHPSFLLSYSMRALVDLFLVLYGCHREKFNIECGH